MWYRIFGRNDSPLSPAALLEHLHRLGLMVEAHFRGDDLGWTAADLRLGPGTTVNVERYLTQADNLRNDFNNWAAILETCDYSPNNVALMERVIQSAQMITLHKPIERAEEISVDRMCLEVCRFLAEKCDGIYQIDADGWYDADGEMLLKEY